MDFVSRSQRRFGWKADPERLRSRMAIGDDLGDVRAEPPMYPQAMISFGWRLALLAKASLLLAMSAGFAFLGFRAATAEHAMLVRLLVLLPCGFLAFFVAWAASLGLLDALLGKSVTEAGATLLHNRWQGYSMRTPKGRFVEFILWNPWGPLNPDATYTVTYGRFSGVLVRKPEATTG